MTHRNLAQLHRQQAEIQGPRIALRYKQYGLYHDITWSDYREMSLACAAALVEAGVQPGDRVGLFAENRWEWLVTDLGILAAGAVNVTPHAPLTARQVHYELSDSGTTWLFVSTRGQYDKIAAVRDELPAIGGIVSFDRLEDTHAPGVIAWQTFLQRGRRALPRVKGELQRREEQLNRDSLATLMYTSGTTGQPKGVMLTHGNILSNVAGVLEASPPRPTDVFLSWLPYSHIFARTCDHYRTLAVGLPLCLAESVDTLVENLAEIRPTHMNSVPRFYEKILAAYATDDPEQTGRKLREVFGGRIDWLTSGGAALPVPIAQAYLQAGLLVLQGYGLTESSPVISFNTKEHYKLDTVGRALPGVEVKIAPDGEILTRGPHVMKGYWKKPEETAAVLKDGWLYTGDLGSLDDEGFLKITGRKKELMILSSGKKVVPSYLEGLLVSDPCIEQAVINGEGRNFLTALIVPNWANLRAVLAGNGVDVSASEEVLCKHPAVEAELRQRIDRALQDVTSWEHVRKFVVLPRPFSVAAEELTVSLKLRRNVVLNRYRHILDQLYQD